MAASNRASLEQAEHAARAIGQRLAREMPAGWGFILWLESFGPDGFAQGSRTQTMQQHGATKKERWERDANAAPATTGRQLAQVGAAARGCGGQASTTSAAQQPQIAVPAPFRGANGGATRNRLPVGPTEAELLTGYAVAGGAS